MIIKNDNNKNNMTIMKIIKRIKDIHLTTLIFLLFNSSSSNTETQQAGNLPFANVPSSFLYNPLHHPFSFSPFSFITITCPFLNASSVSFLLIIINCRVFFLWFLGVKMRERRKKKSLINGWSALDGGVGKEGRKEREERK